MQSLKSRILALVLIVLGIGLVYLNWHQLLKDGTYSMKMAAFGPLIGVGGLFLLVFVVGLAAGLINWYLMDPGFFGR